MNYKSYFDLQKTIKSKLSIIQANNVDLIVGIPRSGMIPAYIIAQYLNKDCCDLNSLINNTPLKTVSAQNFKDTVTYPREAQNILLVDDCISSGVSLADSLAQVPKNEKNKITTLAIYSSEKKRNDVDIFLEYHPGPALSEWHFFHCGVVKNSCSNIEGVLSVTPNEEQTANDENYRKFILNASPLFLPSGKIGSIVTDRPGKFRSETVVWLRKNSVEYDSLIMLELPNEKKSSLDGIAIHKAKAYKKARNELFYEGDREQCIKIHKITKKPVYCVETNEMFSKGNIISAIYGSKYSRNRLLKSLITNIKKLLPASLYKTLRSVYRLSVK